MIPIKLYKETIDSETGKKKVEEVKSDPRIKMLNVESGDTLDAFQMRKAWVQDYLLDKGGYLFIEKAKNKLKEKMGDDYYNQAGEVKNDTIDTIKDTGHLLKKIISDKYQQWRDGE